MPLWLVFGGSFVHPTTDVLSRFYHICLQTNSLISSVDTVPLTRYQNGPVATVTQENVGKYEYLIRF